MVQKLTNCKYKYAIGYSSAYTEENLSKIQTLEYT